LRGLELASEKAIQAFPKKGLPIFPVRSKPSLHGFLEIVRQSHLVITGAPTSDDVNCPFARHLGCVREAGLNVRGGQLRVLGQDFFDFHPRRQQIEDQDTQIR